MKKYSLIISSSRDVNNEFVVYDGILDYCKDIEDDDRVFYRCSFNLFRENNIGMLKWDNFYLPKELENRRKEIENFIESRIEKNKVRLLMKNHIIENYYKEDDDDDE